MISFGKNLPALIYCRVSSKKQKNEGHGLDGQEYRCQKYADESGYTVEDVFRDDHTGGGDFMVRPAMKELIQYLEDHPEKDYFIIFDDLKRLARDVVFHLKLRQTLKTYNATPKCLNFNFDDTPEGAFIETIIAASGELERKQNRRQVIQKMRARLEKGYAVFCPPTGMRFRKDKVHGRLLEPKPETRDIIKTVLEGFATDRFLNQVDVQKYLEKYKGLFGKKRIHLEFVYRMLTEILYTDHVQYLPWDISRRKGFHEGIISTETYDKVQSKLTRNLNSKKVKASDKVEFPLRRLVNCKTCGEVMTGSCNKGKRLYYANYTCNNTPCTAQPKNIRNHILEEDFIELLKSIAPREEVLVLAKVIAKDVWDKTRAEKTLEIQAALSKQSGLENDLKKYVDLAGKTSSEVVRRSYEDKIETLQKEISEFKKASKETPTANFEDALSEVLAFLGTPANYWENADLEGKFLVHQMVFTENPYYDSHTKFGTPRISLPFAVNRHFDSSKNGLVEMAGIEPASKKEVRNRLLS